MLSNKDLRSGSLRRDVLRHIRNNQYERTPHGLFFPRGLNVMAEGMYEEALFGVVLGRHKNTVTDEGFVDLLKTYWDSTAKKPAFYIALFAGAVTPDVTWTAATFPATASEIISTSEGYTGSTRPTWNKATPTTPQIDNYANKAAYSIVTAGTLNVNGAAMLSNANRGSTAGVLFSAARFANTRSLQNTDDYAVGFRVTFTSA